MRMLPTALAVALLVGGCAGQNRRLDAADGGPHRDGNPVDGGPSSTDAGPDDWDGGARDGARRDGSMMEPGSDAGLDAGSVDGAADAAVGSCEEGLVAWYRFERTEGPVVDECGGHDGRTEGTGFTRGVAGRHGRAIAFDGTDGRVVVPHSSELDFVTAGTIELWVSVESDGVGSTVSRGTGNNDDNVLQNTSCWNIQTIFSRSAGGTTNVTSECDTLPVGDFAHLAVVNDGAELRLYIDGELEKTGSGGHLGPVAKDLYIGRREQGIFPFDGVIDEIKWWTVARTPAEICTDAGGTPSGSSCVL